MSREDNRKYMNAYEKMLKDGSAFKQIDMQMSESPSVGDLERGDSAPLGNKVNERRNDNQIVDDNDGDYSEFDSVMEQRMNKLRNKAGMSKNISSGGGINKEIQILKSKVKKLEEALMLVMETQTKLIG